MFRLVAQSILLLAASGLGLSPLLRASDTSPIAPTPAPVPSSTRALVAKLEGRAVVAHTLSGRRIEALLREGALQTPSLVTLQEGQLEVRFGGARLAMDEGARFFLGHEGLRLSEGRLRVEADAPFVVRAAGETIEGRRFGLWVRAEGALLAGLSELKVGERSLPTGSGLRLEKGGRVTPLASVLELEPRPGPRAGLLQVTTPAESFVFVQRDALLVPRRSVEGRLVYVEGVTPLLRDPLGRWAVPGRPSRGLEDMGPLELVAGDRAILDRLEALSTPVAVPTTEREAPPPTASAAETPLPRRSRRPGPSAKKAPRKAKAQEARRAPPPPSSAGPDGREPPSSLQVDWTKLGRPPGSVLEGSKKEAPAPGSR